MTAGNPPLGLLGLPNEILENVVLRLCAQEILKLRIVMSFPLLLRSSVILTPDVDLHFLPPFPLLYLVSSIADFAT